MSNGQGVLLQRHRHRIHSLPKAGLWLALCIAIPGNSAAFDVDYEVGLSVRRSDNINLSEFDPVSDTVLSPQLRFETIEEGPRLQVAARGDVRYLHYTGDTFDNDVRSTFAGKLNWNVLPGRLDFVVQDYLSSQPVDELRALTPDNEQQANVFIAGPTLHARFNAVTRAQLDLRYTNSYAQNNDDFNGDRYDAAVRLLRRTSALQTVSLNAEATRAEFDTIGAVSGYRSRSGYVGYETNRNKVDANIALGHTRLTMDDNGGGESGALVRATVDWRLTPRSLLTVTARNQLTDATQSIITPTLDLERQNFGDFRLRDVSIRPNPFREQMLRMRYQHTGERLTTRLVPYVRRVRYLDGLTVDQTRRGALAEIEYRLRPRLSLSLLGLKEHRKYTDLDRKDEDSAFSIGLVNRFTRHWTGRVDLQRRQRDSTVVGRSHEADSVMLSLYYQR